MSQMVLPNQGEIKDIFPWVMKEGKQEGRSFPLQDGSSFGKILAKVNQEDERSDTPSALTSADSLQKPEEEAPYEGKDNSKEEGATFGQDQEINSPSVITEHEKTPDHGEEEMVTGENLIAAVFVKETVTDSARQDEGERRVLQGAPHLSGQREEKETFPPGKLSGKDDPLSQKEGKGAATPSQVNILGEEHPEGLPAEKNSFFTKGEKGEINLTNATANKQEQSAIPRGSGNVAEEVVVLAGEIKKGAEANDLSIKSDAFNKAGDIQVTAMPSSGADTKHNSNDTKPSPFALNSPGPSDSPESQAKTPFAVASDNQNEGIAGEEELIVSGKESVSQGNVSGAVVRHVYTGDRVVSKDVIIPLEQIVQETGSLLEKGGKVQLILHPPSLGKINMEVIVRNNRVELLMMVSNTEVQQVLQASSDQLRNALQNQGFQFDQMSVLLKRENLGFNSEGHPLWQNGQQEGGRREGRRESAPAEELAELKNMYYDETKNISIFV